MLHTKKIIQQNELREVNPDTGEITSHTENKVFTLPKEPPYIKMYLEDLERLYKLPTASSPVLYELLRQMNYDGLINLNASVKKRICEKVNYKKQSLDNYLSALIKAGVFRRADRGVYQPDPHLFGKGDWMSIYKQREAWLNVSYSSSGKRVITSSLSSEKQQDLDLD